MSQLLIEKYEALCEKSKDRSSELFFEVQDIFQRFSLFDPVSGEALEQPFSVWLRMVLKKASFAEHHGEGYPLDRLTRLFAHSMHALNHIMDHLRSNVTREHAMLPVYAVRELDSSCMMWLARQPGMNFRQKLSGKKTMRAVRRYMSRDTLENRLLKAYAVFVCDLLEQRKDFGLPLGMEEEFLFDKIRIWLKSEDAAQIGRWVNSTPNNVLLQDGSYSKVWKSWQRLQSLDDDTKNDINGLNRYIFRAVYWQFLSRLFHTQGIYLAERECSFEYDTFKATYKSSKDNVISGFFCRGDEYFPINLAFSEPDNEAPVIRMRFDSSTLMFREDSEKGSFLLIDADGNESILGDRTRPLQEIAYKLLERVLAVMGNEMSACEHPVSPSIRKAEEMIIDPFGAYVRYLVNGEVSEVPCRSVVQLFGSREEKDKDVWLDTKFSRAITVSRDENICTYSFRSLCADEVVDDDSADPDILNEKRKRNSDRRQWAAKLLTDELKAIIKPDTNTKVSYLIPDGADDFGMADLRRQFNICFPDSQPVPRSIAGVFEWIERQKDNFNLKNGDWFFVLDEQGQGITLTPIRVCIDERLKKKIPEGQGIILERHPVSVLKSAEEVRTAMKKSAPLGIDPEVWQDISKVWGIRDMTDEGDRLLWCVDDAVPFAEKRTVDEILGKLTTNLNLSEAEIKEAAEEYRKGQGQYEYIDISPAGFMGSKFCPKRDIMTGVDILNCWQEKAPDDIYLWRDYLPALKMKVILAGQAQYIDLVKDGYSVQPRRGERQPLPPINVPMELPRNAAKIVFPLIQGNRENETARHCVSLKSSHFPLKKALPVQLEMYYTYGAEYPYELVFVGTENKKIKISASWESEERKAMEDWMIPALPEKPDAEEVMHQKMWYHKRELPLDEFLSVWLDDLVSNVRFMNGDTRSNRRYMKLSQPWELDKKQKYHMLVNYQGEMVWIHQSQFIKNKTISTFNRDCDEISFDLEESWRDFCDYSAINIMPGRKADTHVIYQWRWPVFQLRSLGMPNAWPYRMQELLYNYMSVLEELYFQTTDNDSKYCILRFACVLGDYMPSKLAWELVRLYQTKKHEGFFDIERWTGYALGSLRLDWQQEILMYAFNREDFIHEEERLNMFAIAFWGDENFAARLSLEYVRQLLELLTVTADCLMNGGIKKRNQESCLKNYMETAMGLMRARVQAKHDMRFWQLLNPQKLSVLISKTEQLIAYVQQHDIEHAKSFLDIDDQRPEDMKNMDLLYYATSCMISCESQEGTLIRIKGIRFD